MTIILESGIKLEAGITIEGNENGGGAVSQFINDSFNNGLDDWTYNDNLVSIQMGGGSIIGGWPTPVDPNPTPAFTPPFICGGPCPPGQDVVQNNTVYVDGTEPPIGATQYAILAFEAQVPAGGNNRYLLYAGSIINNTPVQFNSGDTIRFDWRSFALVDPCNVYAYLLNANTGATQTLLRSTGEFNVITEWTTISNVVSVTGEYYFVFVNGSWDRNGGGLLGSEANVTKIKRVPQT